MPDILTHARSHRAQLLQHEREAEERMVRAYEPVVRRLDAAAAALGAEIEADRKAGRTVSPIWPLQHRRLESLKAQARQEMARFARLAATHTTRAQVAHAGLALEHTRQLVETQIPANLQTGFDLLHTPAIETLVGTTREGTPLHDLFRGLGEDVAENAGSALVSGVAMGLGAKAIGQMVHDASAAGLARANTIARTETLRAYRESARAGYAANPHAVSGWIWRAFGDACPSCQAMNGTRHESSESLDSHPNCRCVMIPIAHGSDVKVTPGPDRFDKLPEAKQREILGPTKFELFQAGRIILPDLVTVTHSERWGAGKREATVAEALAHAHERTSRAHLFQYE